MQKNSTQKTPFDNLIGTWTCVVDEDSITEVWHKTNDSLFTGYSIGISPKGDTSQFETFEVSKIQGVWAYVPVVKGKNDDKGVHFPLADTSNGIYTFLNAKIKFPSVIKYNLNYKDSVFASISGVFGGQEVSVDFPMRRLKK